MEFQENSYGIVIDVNITTLFHILVNKRYLSKFREKNYKNEINNKNNGSRSFKTNCIRRNLYHSNLYLGGGRNFERLDSS